MFSRRLNGVLLAAAFATAGLVKGNLLTNGSFETGSINPGSFTNLASGSTTIDGWTVALGNIDYIGSLWNASNGSRSLDLEGSAGTCDLSTPNCPGGIEQTFNTIIGTQYIVTFDLAGNPFNSPLVKTIHVSAAGQSTDFTFDTTGKTVSNMGWATKTWMFTAADTSTTLEFDTGDMPPTGWGPALDNVSVEAAGSSIPEPASFLLMGAGLIALARFRKR